MKVKDCMSKRLITVSPEESTDVAARLLSRHNIGVLPVCSKDGKLRGMLTDRDIVLRCVAAQEDACTLKVKEIMTRRVLAVDAEEPISAASELMTRQQLHRLPVLQQGRVIGMLSLSDLAQLPNNEASTARIFSEITQNVRSI